jgi:phage terminase large subunit-like protein
VALADAPARTEGAAVARFIETFCRPSKLSARIELRAWQRELINELFTLRADGLRRYRQALIGMPRKNGKSTISAALALYGLLMDDEPGPEVYSVAGDRMQAGIVFREAKAMIEAEPELSNKCRIYAYHIEVPETGGIYRTLSAEAPRAQGLNPSLVIFDEVHVQPNEDLWSAMVTGMATRRQPLIIGITTAGYDKGTLCGRLYERGKRIQSGEVEDAGFFMRWWEPADPQADWLDPAVWAEANPAYGDFLVPGFFEDLIGDPRQPRTPESVFRRYHLNQWTSSKEAWLPHGVWEQLAAPHRQVEPGEPVILFFDGAWTGDSVALVGCTVNNPHVFVRGHWEPQRGEPIDPDEIDAAVQEAHAELNVKRMGCDPFLWRREIIGWRQQGLPVVEWPTNAISRMAPACSEFYRGAVDKRFTHDGDPRLARHIRNAAIKDDRNGRRIVKQSSATKIDLAVAAVGAYDMARKSGADKRPARMHTF